jgi:hypothetical protein
MPKELLGTKKKPYHFFALFLPVDLAIHQKEYLH